MRHRIERAACSSLLVLLTSLAGCSDLLTVEDPESYSSEDLDEALGPVAAGVEGELHDVMDGYVIYTALLSDVFAHTGTWAGYDDYDHGRIGYARNTGGEDGASNGIMNDLLRTRWSAQDATARFERVLGAEAATSPLMVQVQSSEAWANLLIAQSFCEAPAEADGPAVSDTELYARAVEDFTEALGYAETVDDDAWIHFNLAGRARANLMLGDFDAALADAQAIPDGFAKDALYSIDQENAIVNLTTVGFNTAAGMRPKWWPQVNTAEGYLIDPYTGAVDRRVRIVHEDGALGVDGNTPHYSQFKYEDVGADIPLTHADEMRLIEAEVYWQRGDLALALETLNALRAAVDLEALPATGDPNVVRDYLLHERFAELYMEGQRLNDLHRFGLVGELLSQGAFAGHGGGQASEAVRPTKFPLSDTEGLRNPQIEDDASVRCLPMSG